MPTTVEAPVAIGLPLSGEPPPASGAAPRRPRPHRLTIARYERMAAAGVFSEREPVFLWEGRLAEKMTKGDFHNFSETELGTRLIRIVPVGWHVRHETPMKVRDDGMPEPDLTVVRGAALDYKTRTPTAQDVALIVEVADSSLEVDSGEVMEVYAREGIPVYWIVNIPYRWIEVFTRPSGPADVPRYAERRIYRLDDEVPVVLDGREVGRVAVRDILP